MGHTVHLGGAWLAVGFFAAAAGACRNESASEPASDRCEPPPSAPAHGGALRWYEEDAEAALACARRLGRPLVLDLWAPWCHTCLSMQQTVLADPSLARYAEHFVWLSLDTDRPENEDWVKRYPPLAWPTFYLVDPETRRILSRFVGAASLDQFRAFLEAEPDAATSVDALLSEAHAAEAERDWRRAGVLYDRALAAAGLDWPRRPDILVSRLRGHVKAEQYAEGLEFAGRVGLQTGRSASATDFLYYTMACAKHLSDAESPVLDALGAHVLEAVEDGSDMSVDDRSDALVNLRELALLQGREDDAKALALRQKKLLDQVLDGAPPQVVMTYNWPAVEVYAFLGRHAEIAPVVEANMKALPDEYDPPYRLAWLWLHAGEPDRARPYAQQALNRVYGPRKARVYDLLADIEKARGDREAERAARAGTVRVYEGLDSKVVQPGALESARERLADVPTADFGP